MLNRGDNMIQIYDKFSLSKDNNIFLAKRNIIDNIYIKVLD